MQPLNAFILALSVVLGAVGSSFAGDQPVSRSAARELYGNGFYREAAAAFQRLALDPAASSRDVAIDVDWAVRSFIRLDAPDEALNVMDAVQKSRPESWRIGVAVTDAFNQLAEARYEYGPGSRRAERLRVDSLIRLHAASERLGDPADPATDEEAVRVYSLLARTLLTGRDGELAWRLLTLTDLSNPSQYDDAPEWYSLPHRNAPVAPDGLPVFHSVPSSWDDAATDGERYRWALQGIVRHGGEAVRDLAFGRFLLEQFGVQTMGMGMSSRGGAEGPAETGPFAVRTLRDDETIARLATGLKRFSLPDEYNFIRLLGRAAENGADAEKRAALALLASIAENRQQYTDAVGYWRRLAALPRADDTPDANQAILRITGRNGVLEPGPVAPAGKTTVLTYLFRNGDEVRFRARRLDERKLLQDIVARFPAEGDAMRQDYLYRRPEMLGMHVVEQDEDRYIGDTVAEWAVGLEALPGHYSRRVRVELPFSGAGCYLVEASMRDGNTSRIVLWIHDLALVRKSAGPREILFVADAVSGELVPGTALSFHGVGVNWRNGERSVEVDEFADKTDTEGLAAVDASRLNGKEWLIIATTDDGRLAYQGFDPIWVNEKTRNGEDTGARAFAVTDRPVYRPGDPVRFKLWFGYGTYRRNPGSVAGRDIPVVMVNPRGETVFEKTLTTDEWGGAEETFTLDATAPLGQYHVYSPDGLAGVGFRLEEYRNPEYEVTVETPEKPLRLGDTTQVKIRAAYYHGAPVASGTVKYKIIRTPHRTVWTPPWRWDWLYGNGAWLSRYDYTWYPGWQDWSLPVPVPPWMPRPYSQPEVVADGEGVLDADGLFRLDLDTMPARELFGNEDHSYAITAEVTDQSRRVITGGGTVIATRKPFSVNVWTDRGFYPAGQEVTVRVAAVLPGGGPVRADGHGVLHRIRYTDDGRPEETAVQDFTVGTGEDGQGLVSFPVSEAGQYRFGLELRDADGNVVQGGVLITIRGEAGDGEYRFAALELVPEKNEYRPGETLRLAVNSENHDGLVVLFPRAERNGQVLPGGGDSYSRPEVLRLQNGQRVWETDIAAADQPNFFCDAVTVFAGRVYTETREIFVPPVDKTLTVEVTADRDDYGPGAEAAFTVRVTDSDGTPVVGQVAATVYDRSVDSIAGGSNVGDIREAFWQWKRHYFGGVTDSLSRSPYQVARKGDTFWQPIGLFGSDEADWNDAAVHVNGQLPAYAMARPVPRMQARGGGPMLMADSAAMPAPAMAMESESGGMRMKEVEAPRPMLAGAASTASMYTGDAGELVDAVVRSDFADTAFWSGDLLTDENGVARFTVTMPDSLTAWRVRAWTMSTETRVGAGETAVVSKKNIMIRPQSPRFLTEKDEVILSANLHNYLPRAKQARAELVLEGGLLQALDGESTVRSVDLPASGEVRVDWRIRARRPGTARVVMRLLTDEESDAAEVMVPVQVHGARRVESWGGVIRGETREAVMTMNVPVERLPDQSRLEVSFSPNVAGAVLEAIPYLVDYPYGCTEQTLNRFLPAVMARRFLEASGADLAEARFRLDNAPTASAEADAWQRTFGGPEGKTSARVVFDDEELNKVVRAGVERLASMQNTDGGWGWFSGSGEQSYPHTTAVVVYGLLAARDNGVPLPFGLLERGIDWLRARQAGEIARLRLDPEDPDNGARAKGTVDDLDAFTYLILATNGKQPADPDMREFLFRDRLGLSRSALAMYALALHIEGATNALRSVDRNLRQFVKTDEASGTAWLETPGTGWWFWYNDRVETQAWFLKYLSRVEATGPLASGVAKYLMENRKNGSYWKSTRDTAYAIEALTAYSVASGENTPDFTVQVYLNDEPVLERRFTRDNALGVEKFSLDGLALEAGEYRIRLVVNGSGNLYYGASLGLFSLEDPIPASGGDLQVERIFHRLVRDDGQVAMPDARGAARDGRVEKYRRELLASPFPQGGDTGGNGSGSDSAVIAETLQPGDLVEVTLNITARNDYEYIVMEDMKAAGLEAVEVRSGYQSGRGELGAYVEYRDNRVVLFIRNLPRGEHTVRYRFRAETPGAFSALPAFGGGMYATDLRANSGEMKIRVTEGGVFE